MTRDARVEIRDQNGEGQWSVDRVLARYRVYSKKFAVTAPRDLSPEVAEDGGVRWISPVMTEVIKGIEDQDPACAQIGIEFLEEDRGFVFGAILKSNTARALRRFERLTADQIDRIRRRIAAMYSAGIVPREFRQYLRLLRRVGPGGYWAEMVAAQPKNRLALRARTYLDLAFDRDGRPRPV